MESQGVDKSFEKWIRGERLGLGQRELWKRFLVSLRGWSSLSRFVD